MASRLIGRARIYSIAEPVEVGDEVTLPTGRYPGWEEYTEARLASGELKRSAVTHVLELDADDIRTFGGHVNDGTPSVDFLITIQVAQGRIR